MEIRIHHLSGSRTGETQSFQPGQTIRLGRGPDLEVRFDPDKDRIVSTVHAKLSGDGQRWVLQDLKSSNGTFVGPDRITERELRSGDVIELGKNGPRLRVEFNDPRAVPGTVMSDLPIASVAPVGRTVMMSLDDPQSQPPRPGSGPVPPTVKRPAYNPRKKGGPLKALLIVGAVLLILVGLAVAGALLVRQRNLAKRNALVSTRDTNAALLEKARNSSAVASTEVVAKQVKLQQAQTDTASVANSQAIEDLKRQLEDAKVKEAEHQRLEDQITRQLQESNDRLAAVSSRPPPIVYRTRESRPAPPVHVVDRSPADSKPAPAPVPYRPDTPHPASVPATPRSTTHQPEQHPTPVETNAQLFNGRVLRKKFNVAVTPPPVPLANMPSSTGRELALALSSALESTGHFVFDSKAPASVSIAVTSFRSSSSTTNTQKATNAASGIGRLLGHSVPSSPVDAGTTSFDAALSMRVELYDLAGRKLAETEPEAESALRKSNAGIGGLQVGQLAASDTALGDVIRKVVADSVDNITPALSRMSWLGNVASQQQNGAVVIAAGRNTGVQIGDVFEMVDTAGRPGARIRVTSVGAETSECETITPSPKKMTMVRYLGNEAQSSPEPDRYIVTRIKTNLVSGPGNSFRTLRTVNAGTRMKFQYAVGPWARVEDGGFSWILVSAGKISG